jgi:hypothetical protein
MPKGHTALWEYDSPDVCHEICGANWIHKSEQLHDALENACWPVAFRVALVGDRAGREV